MKENSSALTPTVKRLGLVSLFADISSEMLYPITPIFLTTVLGASAFNLGVIEGVAEGIASLLKTYSGAWSDKIHNRKPFVWVGYLLSALAKPLTGWATAWQHVLSARSLDRLGKGIRTSPRDALIAEAVPEHLRGAAYGWHRGMDTLGAAIGPLLAILFLSFWKDPNDLRQIYFWSLLPGLIAVAIALSVKEKKKQPISTPPIRLAPWKSLNPQFKQYLTAWAAFSLCNSSDIFLLLKAQKEGQSLTMTILFYSLYNLTYALSSPLLGKISDTCKRKNVLMGGLAVFAVVYLLFGFATESWHFWSLFFIYGLYMGATDGVGKAYAVDLVPSNLKATGLGLLGTITGLTTIIASSAAGFLWDRFGSHWTFFFGACGALAAIALLSRIHSTRSS